MFNIRVLLYLNLLFCAICHSPLLAGIELPPKARNFIERIKSVNNLNK